jgi:hypothetical protein
MYYRLESTQHNNRQQQWFNFILLVCGFLGFEAFINKIFQALIPGENTGLWAWVVPALVILPILMISAVSRKPWAHESANSVDKKPGYLKTAAAAAVISALSAGGTWLYLAYSHGKRDFLSSELIDFTRLISGLGVSSWLAEMLTIALPVAVAGFFTLLAALLASKDLADRQYQKAFVTLAALAAIAPASVTVPTLVTIALIAMHCRHFQSAVAAALVAALSTALPLIFFCR